MTQYCIALDCYHNNKKNDCKMYSFPTNETLKTVWIQNLGLRGSLPNSHLPLVDSSVCSCHFAGGSLPVHSNRNKRKQSGTKDVLGIPSEARGKRIRREKKTSKERDLQYQEILNCLPEEERADRNTQNNIELNLISTKDTFKKIKPNSHSKFPSVTLVKTEDPLKSEFSSLDYTDIIEVSEANISSKDCPSSQTVLSIYDQSIKTELNDGDSTLKEVHIESVVIDSLPINANKDTSLDTSFIVDEKLEDTGLDNVTILLLEPSKKPSAIKRPKPSKRGRRTRWSLSRIDLGISQSIEEDEALIKIEKMVPSPEGQDEIVETDVGKTPEERLSEEHKRLSFRLDKLNIRMKEVSAIKSYQRERLTITKLKSNPDMLNYYTGIKSLQHFHSIVQDVNNHSQYQKQPHLDILKIEEQILLTFMKLWRNFLKEDLAFRFRIDVPQTQEIIFNLILILHDVYYRKLPCNGGFLFADIVLEQIYEDAILVPSSHSSNCRVIIDCIKAFCRDEKIDDAHELSTKLEKYPFKGFVAVTPQKSVIFTSDLFPESKSTLDIFESYGILDKVLDGKMILSDNCLSYSDRFIKGELNQSHKIDKRIRSINSKVRLHIGKVTMCQIKKYSVLNNIPSFLSRIASQVYQLCSALVNLHSSFNQE